MQDKHSRSRSLFLNSLSLLFPKNDVYYYYYYHTTTTTTTTTTTITITTTTLHYTTTNTSNTNLLYSTIKKNYLTRLRTKWTEKASKNKGGCNNYSLLPLQRTGEKARGSKGGANGLMKRRFE